jgi:hypothetical protein
MIPYVGAAVKLSPQQLRANANKRFFISNLIQIKENRRSIA